MEILLHLDGIASKMLRPLLLRLRHNKIQRVLWGFSVWQEKGKFNHNFIKIWLRVEIRLTQSNEIGDLINSINNIQINGNADVITAVKIAQLSLKHRQNKSQKQRIIVFVGHPVSQSADDFEDLGLRLKKNNVAIDVINFANPGNVEKLEALVNAANMEDSGVNTCNFLDVPMGVTHITDVMITSPILQPPADMGMGGDASGAAGGGGAANDPYGGLNIDPNMDPELAEAIRISLEEAKAAEQAASGNQEASRP